MENLIEHELLIKNHLFDNLNKQRDDGLFCDLVLKTEDGGTFYVHKCVLAAQSQFFFTNFQSELNDENNGILELEKVSSFMLRKILEYIYIGKTTVPSEVSVIAELLDNALFFRLHHLVNDCSEILIQLIDVDTYCDIWSYSCSFYQNIRKMCHEFVFDNFDSLIEKNFHKISSDLIEDLVSTNRKSSRFLEETLFLAVTEWIQYDFENRQQYICQLLDKIHFDRISNNFFYRNIINKDNPLKQNADYINKVFDLYSKHMETYMNQGKGDELLSLTNENDSLSITADIYGIVGEQIQKFNFCKNEFEVGIKNLDVYGVGYTTFNNENLFICGGLTFENSDQTNSCKYLSFCENEWIELPSMILNREFHRALTLNNKIYVCGGLSDVSTEIFDLEKGFWNMGPSLFQNVYSFGFCSNGNCIYTVDSENFVRWDIREECWMQLPQPPFDFENTAVSYENFIYAFNLTGAYKFDLRNNQWETIITSKEKQFHYEPHACLINNQIYVLGSTTCDDSLLKIYNASDLSVEKCLNLQSSPRVGGLFNLKCQE